MLLVKWDLELVDFEETLPENGKIVGKILNKVRGTYEFSVKVMESFTCNMDAI